jgi:hypothetical protein
MVLGRDISAGVFLLYAIGFSYAVVNFFRAIYRQKENLYVFIRVPELMVLEQLVATLIVWVAVLRQASRRAVIPQCSVEIRHDAQRGEASWIRAIVAVIGSL